jgi:hypothetical protein
MVKQAILLTIPNHRGINFHDKIQVSTTTDCVSRLSHYLLKVALHHSKQQANLVRQGLVRWLPCRSEVSGCSCDVEQLTVQYNIGLVSIISAAGYPSQCCKKME